MLYKQYINNIIETRGRYINTGEYKERHHIIPKCMGGTNKKNNLVDLYAHEHFIAHKLLAEEYPNIKQFTFAFWRMAQIRNKQGKCTPEEYEKARIAFSEAIKGTNSPSWGRKHTNEERQKMRENHVDFSGSGHPRYGKKVSSETRRKISEANKGKFSGVNNPSYGVGRSVIAICPKSGREIGVYNTMREAAEATGANPTVIGRCCRGQNETSGGYKWRYND